MTAEPWPLELRVSRAQRRLTVRFDTGERFELPAALLRVMTTAADARGHGALLAGPDLKPLAIDASEVGIKDVTPIGRYAVRIAFDDGHDTGLYTWAALHRMGRDRSKLEAEHKAMLRG